MQLGRIGLRARGLLDPLDHLLEPTWTLDVLPFWVFVPEGYTTKKVGHPGSR